MGSLPAPTTLTGNSRALGHPPLLTPIEVDGHRSRNFGPGDPGTQARGPGDRLRPTFGPATDLLPRIPYRSHGSTTADPLPRPRIYYRGSPTAAPGPGRAPVDIGARGQK